MKKVIIYAVAAVALLACASCANKKNVITGHFDGLPCDSLKVEVVDILNARVPLSTTIIPATNGDFTFPFADTTVRGIIIYCPDDESNLRSRRHGDDGAQGMVFDPSFEDDCQGEQHSP